MNSVLITGCNRGLGLGLVKAFLAQTKPPNKILATMRGDLSRAEELQKLAQSHGNLKVLSIDVTDFESFPKLVDQVQAIVGDSGLNMLINNAGYSPKFTRLGYVKAEDLEKTFKINCVAPIMLTKAMKGLLKTGSPSWVVNMSSILGSISENKDGGMYPYKVSKTALNAATKSMSIDLRDDRTYALALHPGWVKTAMGGKNAPLNIEESCADMVKLLTNLSPDQNGKFLQHNGKELPW